MRGGTVCTLWLQRDQPSQIDRYLACGETYRVLRDAVGKAMIECKMKGIAAAQKVRLFSPISIDVPLQVGRTVTL